MNIQIVDGKVGKTLLGVVNKHFVQKRFVDNAQQCFAEKIKTNTSNVHNSLKVMGSNPGFLLKPSLLYLGTYYFEKEFYRHFFPKVIRLHLTTHIYSTMYGSRLDSKYVSFGTK